MVARPLHRLADVGGQGEGVMVREVEEVADVYKFESSPGSAREAESRGQALLPE